MATEVELVREDLKEFRHDMNAYVKDMHKTLEAFQLNASTRLVRIESLVDPLRKFGWTILLVCISPWFKGCI